ncbi:hypothetical protein ACHWQZ_G015441 [Mnemiopsis leidyi]
MTELFAIFAAKKRLKRYGAVQTTRMNANEVKEKWLNIQKRSYTNWINEVLRPTGVVVNDIVDDIGSGVLLCKLAMLLTMKKIKYQRNPKMVFQRQENIQKALILIEQSGCKLIGIGASDILTKNEKLILGLMWQLIQHFHVFQSIKNVEKMKQQLKSEQLMGNARDGETDEIYDNDLKSSDKQKKSSAIKRQILADLNKRLAKRGVEVDNLTKDWKDGEALCALVDYNVRGIYDLYLDSDPVQKVAQSMIAAYKFLGIPQLIEPEDFISNLIDEQTMSMYLSCFVHDGIEEISVDLFEGIKKEEEKVQTVEEIVKKNHVLVKQESVLSMPITPASAVVLDFIQVEPTIRKSNENEEEEKASPGRFKAANQHVTKIISSLPDHSPSRQSSLSEILAPQVRSNSDSSVDEGIGPDILADVSASLQSTPSKGDPDPEKNISSEDVIAKVSLEDSLPASEPVETVSTEPADVADVIEQEIQAVNVTPEVIPVESSALSISDPECSSPGEIELVSEDNQEDIRQKLENEIAASISAEMSSIRNKDDSERLDSSEEKGDETSLSDVENRTGGWGQEGAIITTSLEQVISQEEPEVTDRDLSTPEPLDDEEGETPTIESEKSILEVDLKAIEPSADPVDLTIETEEPIVSEITDEVKVTSEIEVKEPVVNVEATVEVPKIELNTSEEVEDTSTEIAATALEVAASGTLAEAALEAASTPTVDVDVKTSAPEFDIHTDEEPEVPAEVPDLETPEVAISTEVAAPEVPEGAISTEAVAPDVPEVTISTEVVAPEVPEVDIPTEAVAPEVPEVAISTEVAAPEVPEVNISTELVAPEVPEVTIPTEVEAPEVPEVTISTEVAAPEVPEVDIPTEAVAPEVPEVAISTEVAAPEVPEVNISTEVAAPEVPEVTIPTEVVSPDVPEVDISTEIAAPDVPEVAISTEVLAPDVPEVDISAEVVAPDVPEVTIPREVVPPVVPEVDISTEVVAPEVPEANISAEILAPDVPEVAISTEVAAPDVPKVDISPKVAAQEVPEVAISAEVVAPDVPEVAISTEVVTPEVPEVDISTHIVAPDVAEVAISAEVVAPDVPEVNISTDVVAPDVPEVAISTEVAAPEVPEVAISTEVVAPDVPEVDISTEVVAPDVPAAAAISITTDLEVDVPEVETQVSAGLSEPDTVAAVIELPTLTSGFDESSDVEISAGTEPSSDIEVTIPKDDNVAKVSEPEISTKIATESQGVDVDIPMAVISTKVETETVEVGIPASDISKEDTDVDEKVKTPKVEGAADITVSGGDTENEIESLPSIDASFIRDIEFNSDGEMIVPSSTDEPISIEKPIATVEPTLTDEPIYSVSTKQKIPPLVDSEVSVPEKRISVAASSGSSTTKSTKSLRGSIISGGDEISVSKIDKQFPAIDSRLLLLLASMDTTSQEYEAAKEQFRKFIAKSDIDYRSVSFLKCCQLMRASLLAAQFKIVGAGENVMFDDLPFKPKRGFTTLTLKKKKSSKKLEDIDPLLAQLPKSASLKKSHTADQPLSKKQMQRQKELGNASISLYTEVVQCYQNYKTMMQTAQSWQGSQLEASYGDCMDTMQDEVMMGNMILTGLCSPD